MMLMWAFLGWKSLSIQNEKLHLVAQIRSKSQIMFFPERARSALRYFVPKLRIVAIYALFFAKPVHYREVDNGVKSSWPWQIISLWSTDCGCWPKSSKNFHIAPSTQIKTNVKKIYLKKGNNPKNCLWCLLKSILVYKKYSCNMKTT